MPKGAKILGGGGGGGRGEGGGNFTLSLGEDSQFLRNGGSK